MPEPDPQALKLALGWLSRRELLEKEIAAKLAAKGFDQTACEAVLDWLRNRRVVNDVRTVENAVERKNSGKRIQGRLKIREDLEVRGVHAEQIAQALAPADDESELAKMAAILTLKQPGDRGRAGRLLFSKGFEEELIETALDQFFEAQSRASEGLSPN